MTAGSLIVQSFRDAVVLNDNSCSAESSFRGSAQCWVGANEMDYVGNMWEFSVLLTPR